MSAPVVLRRSRDGRRPQVLAIPMVGAARRYQPLDELLEHPRVRILRLLTRHDWLCAYEIKLELGALYETKVRDLYSQHLSRSARAGLLTTRAGIGELGDGPDYAITARGRRELARILRLSRLGAGTSGAEIRRARRSA